jgi:dolichol-phosphate mannosyltransferase
VSVPIIETRGAGASGRQQSRPDPLISVVVPLYNEVGNVGPLLARLHGVLSSCAPSYEIILVDDGSRDGTWKAITQLVAATAPIGQASGTATGTVIGCRLSRNFGHQAALLAGLNTARGDAVITMDGDLQHPPEVIPDLIAQWHAGFDIVGTQRLDGGQTSAFKRVTSRYFYRLFSALTEVDLHEGSSDFRLVDRKVLRQIIALRDNSLFLRGTVEWLGFNKTVIPYQVAERFSGQSKYNFIKMLRFAGSAVVSHSTVPLRAGVWIGIAMSLLACFEIVYVIAMTYAGRTVPGWSSILIIQSFFFGILFILTGIMGIYMAGIYRMLQSRPNFIVADRIASTADSEPKSSPQHVESGTAA